MKIKNDFLGFLISIKQDNGDISVSHILNQSGLSNTDCSHYLKNLQSKGYVQYMDSETYHIYPDGIYAYVPPAKKAFLRVRDAVLYLLGVITPYLVETVIEIVKMSLTSP